MQKENEKNQTKSSVQDRYSHSIKVTTIKHITINNHTCTTDAKKHIFENKLPHITYI